MTPRTKYSGKRPQRTMALLLAIVSMALLPLAGCKQEVDSSPATTPAPSPAPATYTVTFDANGGSGTMESQTFTPNQPKELAACAFTREGHSFDGWSLTKDGPVAYQDKASYPATASATLYAVWTADNAVRRVVASPAGGSSVDLGDTVTLTSATEGATIHYTVNGGAEQTGASPVNVTISAAATISAWATKPGMTDSARSEFTYTLKTYTVTFATSKGAAPEQLTGLAKGSALPDLPVPAVTGYTFGGWQRSDGSTAKKGDTVTGDLTLTAVWSPITYTVVFDSTGGSGTMENLTLIYDRPFKLPKNTFTSTGRIFTGWNTELGGSGTPYADEATVENLASTQGAEVHLCAQWADPVATVQLAGGAESTGYGSLTAAIQAINASDGGGTLTLEQDVTQTSSLSISKEVAIAFGGYTIAMDGNMIDILSGGKVTLKGASGGITNSSTNASPTIVVRAGGSLTIQGGSISSAMGTTIGNYGTLTISGGSITSSNTQYTCIYNNASATATISGGTISATGGTSTVYNAIGGTLTISGGTLSAVNSSVVSNKGTLSLSGGTMTVASGAAAAVVNYLGETGTGGTTIPTLNLSGSPTMTGQGTDSNGFPYPGLAVYSPATITGSIGTAIKVGTDLANLATGSWTAFTAGSGYSITSSDKANLQPVVTDIPADAMSNLPNGGTISTALESGSVVVKVTPK